MKELDGFRVGDIVTVVASGKGFGPDIIGKNVTITELGVNVYFNKNGFRIKEVLGNEKSGFYERWHGLHSISINKIVGRANEVINNYDIW